MIVLQLCPAPFWSAVNRGDVHVWRLCARRQVITSSHAWRCATSSKTLPMHALKPFDLVHDVQSLKLGMISWYFNLKQCLECGMTRTVYKTTMYSLVNSLTRMVEQLRPPLSCSRLIRRGGGSFTLLQTISDNFVSFQTIQKCFIDILIGAVTAAD